MTLKEEIFDLKKQGIKQCDIARKLNCSTGTVSYHCNPEVKKKAISKKRLRRKQQEAKPHPYLNKEIDIELKKVNWRHAEAICNARLIELGYETFIPTVAGGEIDLIAYKDNKIYRIQVKGPSPNKQYLPVHSSRQIGNNTSGKRAPYTNIDWILAYDGTNIYKIEYIDKMQTNLRYRVPISGQVDLIHMASDYIF